MTVQLVYFNGLVVSTHLSKPGRIRVTFGSDPHYYPGQWVIQVNDGDPVATLDKASAKAMQSLGLIKITFTNLTKDKTYVCPHLARILCFNLESILSKGIDKLEQVQQRVTKLVPEIAHLPYEARLQHPA